MSYLPPELRALRRQVRRAIQGTADPDDPRTKKEKWIDSLTEFDLWVLAHCGYSSRRFWKQVSRGSPLYPATSRLQYQLALHHALRERQGQFSFAPIFTDTPTP